MTYCFLYVFLVGYHSNSVVFYIVKTHADNFSNEHPNMSVNSVLVLGVLENFMLYRVDSEVAKKKNVCITYIVTYYNT